LPQLNSHGLQAVDNKERASSGASAPDLKIQLVFQLQGLKPPRESMLAIVSHGLKAGANEKDNNMQLSHHK
jgi:hypothetical protein